MGGNRGTDYSSISGTEEVEPGTNHQPVAAVLHGCSEVVGRGADHGNADDAHLRDRDASRHQRVVSIDDGRAARSHARAVS